MAKRKRKHGGQLSAVSQHAADAQTPPAKKQALALWDHETWDDSALLDSWDAAFEEYKHYHSLHALGVDVDAVLDEAKAEEEAEHAAFSNMRNGGGADVAEGTDALHGGVDGQAAPEAQGEAVLESGVHASVPDGSGLGAAVPQALLAGQDDAMKNVMMAWYWAGYYTGLHEGQSKTAASHGNG